MSVFRFDAVRHVYTLDSVRIPGITEVLSGAGLVSGLQFMTAEGRARGTGVHDMIERLNLDILDDADVPDAWRGYLDAYRLFLDDARPRIVGVEVPCYHAGLRFATHVDIVVDRLCGADELALINIKTGAASKSTGPQTAGEVLALDGRASGRSRYELRLNVKTKRPSYRLDRFVNEDDFAVFVGAVRKYWEGEA